MERGTEEISAHRGSQHEEIEGGYGCRLACMELRSFTKAGEEKEVQEGTTLTRSRGVRIQPMSCSMHSTAYYCTARLQLAYHLQGSIRP